MSLGTRPALIRLNRRRTLTFALRAVLDVRFVRSYRLDFGRVDSEPTREKLCVSSVLGDSHCIAFWFSLCREIDGV